MFTVRLGDKDIPVRDIAALAEMMQAGRIRANTAVYDNTANTWRRAEDIVVPPIVAPAVSGASPSVAAEQTEASGSYSSPTGVPGLSTGYVPGRPKTTPVLAIVAFVCSIVGMVSGFLLGIFGIILGYKARRLIDDNPQQYEGRRFATAAIILGWIQCVIFPVVILMLIHIPNVVQLRGKAYNASAQSVGYHARNAQLLYYQNSGDVNNATYADNLGDLLAWDNNLTDDPDVTFAFGVCNSDGYTFTVQHAKGDETYDFTH
ncbi:MAG: DUF4190 domain-containing protein [Candidatus Lernaella stagnicola]|nr:DUF4190 domain-containing protein [Candidatus Lernaella stagnicola]